jgi:hypothetical protein
MKTIKLRVNGKVVHQFILYDAEVALAEKLGLTKEQYVIEKSKLELEERRKKDASMVIQ